MDRPDQACGEGSGVLPCPCAPLAYPYIPVQGENPPRYQRAEALQTGTLFPGLNLPFKAAIQAKTPMPNTALAELMALDFVIRELNLYLDTHPDDREAFETLQKCIRMRAEGHKRYTEQYGPVTVSDLVCADVYDWLDAPWPWQPEEEEK